MASYKFKEVSVVGVPLLKIYFKRYYKITLVSSNSSNF